MRLALAMVALAWAAPARAAPTVDGLLQRLDGAARATESIAGEFTQATRIKLFKQEIQSKGRFFYQRPRRIRWEYLDPDPSTLVLDGDTAVLKTPGAAPQTFDLARDAVMRAVFDQLLMWVGSGGMARAKADYALTVGGSDEAPSLTLVPRAGGPIARAFARIELRFDAQLLLRSITLAEASGDQKSIAFTKMARNAKLPADAFKP
jgi:outer membrane lipoprotein-sorting protein